VTDAYGKAEFENKCKIHIKCYERSNLKKEWGRVIKGSGGGGQFKYDTL
jgi:hypothetical protein